MTGPRRIMPLPLGGEHGLPYSRGLMARALMAVGVAADRAYSLARKVGDDLAARGSDVVELDRLESLAIDTLGEVEGREALRQLRRYQELRELDLPIVILVGGATGTGKSTVATEIAYRLGITRVTSTDFVRQTMRAFFSHEFMPSIHYSIFRHREACLEARAMARRHELGREERAQRLPDEVGRRDARDPETVRNLRRDRGFAGAG